MRAFKCISMSMVFFSLSFCTEAPQESSSSSRTSEAEVEATDDTERRVLDLLRSIRQEVRETSPSQETLEAVASDLENALGRMSGGNVQDCVDLMCSRMPAYRCDSFSEVQEVRASCENVDSQCLGQTCDRFPNYKCDELSELEAVGQVCQIGEVNAGCVDLVCGKMPAYRCDELSELASVKGICPREVNTRCIEDTCSRLPAYRCDEFSELQAIAESCQ